jgi:spore coat protein U-like protein
MLNFGKRVAEFLCRARRPTRFALAPLVLLFALAFAPAAQAQLCNLPTFTPIAFGNVDVLPGTTVDSAGSITISCPGLTGSTKVILCFGADNGTFPASGGGARQMGSGASRLVFDLYKDAARTVRWTNAGSGLIGVTLTAASPTQVLPFYGRVLGSQQSVPPAAYTTAISVATTGQAFTTGTQVCGAQPALRTDTFNVSATVVSSCTVTTTNLNFGSVSVLSANVDASNSVSVICTSTTPYQVRLDGGVAAATDPTQRKMSLGANKITYGLYRELARSLPWGATDGTNTQAGTGTSSAIGHTIYGRIPPQTSPPPGTYTDTVVVTISFI